MHGFRSNLRFRILATFAVAAMAVAVGIVLVVPPAVDRLIEGMMESHARTIVALERRNIETIARDGGAAVFGGGSVSREVADDLRALVAEKEITRSFAIDSLFLVDGSSIMTIYSRPGSFATLPDPALLAAAWKSGDVTLHRMDQAMARRMDGLIDVVATLRLPGLSGSAIDLRLDFKGSFGKHMAQFSLFETFLVSIALIVEFAQAFLLLAFVRRSAILPTIAISKAMDAVAAGDLAARVDSGSKDEFGAMATRFNGMVLALRQKARMANYVSSQTLAMIHGEDDGRDWRPPKRKTLVILFSDVRGFTGFAERHEPELVIATLNRLLQVQAEAVVACGGGIDKFIGDALMATFRGPRSALVCGLRIQNIFANAPADFLGLRVGIGIAAGTVVEGDIGGQALKDFTVIGDAVNTAARLEALAAAGELLVPESLMAGNSMLPFAWERRGVMRLKGKDEPLCVAAVFGAKSRGGAGTREALFNK